MSEPSLERSLGFLINDVSRLLRKRFDRRAQQVGLTRAQWAVIAHLVRNEGVNQSTLAELLDVQKITLARLVDRLEQDGWVERRPDPADRRANRLYLTEKVGTIWGRMRAIAGEIFEEALDGISPAERDELIDRLIAVKRNLTSPERPVVAGTPVALLGSTGD